MDDFYICIVQKSTAFAMLTGKDAESNLSGEAQEGEMITIAED